MISNAQQFYSKRYSFTYGLYAIMSAIFFAYPPSFLADYPWVALLFSAYFTLIAILRYIKPLLTLDTDHIGIQLHPLFSVHHIAYTTVVKMHIRRRALIIEFIPNQPMSPASLANKFTVIPLHPFSNTQRTNLLSLLQQECPQAEVIKD